MEDKHGDIAGNRYNYLVAIEKGEDYISPKGLKTERWWFQCDCGNKKLIVKSVVTTGKTKSCGCLAKKTSSILNKKENIYDLSQEYGIGWTWSGEKFYFDLEDYDTIKDFCWRLDHRGYVVTEVKEHIYTLAQLVMCPPPHMYVVYKDKLNKLDNRKENLEIAESIIPSKEYFQSKNKTGCVGVMERKGREKKWRATIRVDGHLIDLGSYYTFEEAVEARKKGEKMYEKQTFRINVSNGSLGTTNRQTVD